ncbi:hypothetical protein ACFX1S_041858 [Malus domestica]
MSNSLLILWRYKHLIQTPVKLAVFVVKFLKMVGLLRCFDDFYMVLYKPHRLESSSSFSISITDACFLALEVLTSGGSTFRGLG